MRKLIFTDSDIGSNAICNIITKYTKLNNPIDDDVNYIVVDALLNQDMVYVFNDCDRWDPRATLTVADFLMAHDVDLSDLKEILIGIIDFELSDDRLKRYKSEADRENRKKELLEFRDEVEEKLVCTNKLSRNTVLGALDEIMSRHHAKLDEKEIREKKYPDKTFVCYWNCETPHYYSREEVYHNIKDGWNETEEAKAVVAYMRSGRTIDAYFGYATDRIDGEILGYCDWIGPDEKYIFPEKWEQYIEKYSVKPWNEEFIKDCVEWFKKSEDIDSGLTVDDYEI